MHVVGKLHQTRLSRSIRKSRVFGSCALKWWLKRQGRIAQSALLGSTNGQSHAPRPSVIIDVENEQNLLLAENFAREMKALCGAGKFFEVGYQTVYGPLLTHLRTSAPVILEIGIGVNDPSAPSGMPEDYAPGESLRGLRKYIPNAELHGADCDSRVLNDNRDYLPHWVDQRDTSSLQKLAQAIGRRLDFVIDDGLHTAEANANVIATLFDYLSPNGVIIIEDILPEYFPLWKKIRFPASHSYQFFFPSDLRSDVEAGMLLVRRA